MKVLFIFLISILSVKSCNAGFGSGIKGNGNVISKEISIRDYFALSLGGPGDIVYEHKPDAAPYLRIEIDENLFEYLINEVKNDELIIKPTENISPSKFRIYTNSKNIGEISLKGSGDIHIKGFVKSDDMVISLAGSGDIKADNLQCRKFELQIKGSGDALIAGKANESTMEIAGSGDVNAGDFEVNDLSCRVAGSGDMLVNVTNNLDANVSGSGDIKYKGSPRNVNKSVRGSGSVSSR